MENLGKCILVRNNTFEGWLCPPRRRPPPEYKPHYVKQGKKGSGDFFLILMNEVNMVEAKAPNKKLTEDQIEFKKKAESLGMKFIMIDDFEQLIDLIEGGRK